MRAAAPPAAATRPRLVASPSAPPVLTPFPSPRRYEERREQDMRDRIARDRELGARALTEYQANLALERQRAEEAEAARQAVKRAKHETVCRGIAEQLAAIAAKVTEYRATQPTPLLPPKARAAPLPPLDSPTATLLPPHPAHPPPLLPRCSASG